MRNWSTHLALACHRARATTRRGAGVLEARSRRRVRGLGLRRHRRCVCTREPRVLGVGVCAYLGLARHRDAAGRGRSRRARRVRRPVRSASERRDDSAVSRATARLARQIPDRARPAREVDEELGARVALHESRHALDERRVVDPPEAPLGDGVRLVAMCRVQRVVRLPGGLEALVVEVVRDDVDVLVSGVVRVRCIGGDVRRAVTLRVPDQARLMRGRSPPSAGPPSLRSFGSSSRAGPPRAMTAIRANALLNAAVE